MTDKKPALVLHLSTGGEPLLFALDAKETQRLEADLTHIVKTGAVTSVQTQDSAKVTINFSQVAVAYIDDLQRKGKVFGLH
ncbi:hypothetical protein [Amycolatopsis sp. H20-H5]|uniref:hypothetical protein n=1 Tax=Amycolatopsis sp. H20-H5 TaxID=3046309 RepID=UPI002DB5C069|nr:hypothetical protein [Amycolatopsis sp. H20-H5]MEC3975686.1 hypothetical protein [Amycolatopsis sp. H20-H5]